MIVCLFGIFSKRIKYFQQKLHHKNQTYDVAPPHDSTLPIIHKVRLFHKDIYTIGHKLSKRDKLGIHQTVENYSLRLLSLLVESAFSKRHDKLKTLEIARVHMEIIKNIIRTEYELTVIDEKTYIRLAKDTVEISKMLNGWITYISKI